MGARGRNAGNSLSIVPQGDVVSIPRAKAPAHLTSEQKDLWIDIVNCLPAQHFSTENLPLLSAYCGHVVTEKKLSQLISKVEKSLDFEFIKEYDELLKMRERESRAISSLATRMRLSQQSIYEKDKKRGTIQANRRPWETDGEEA